MQQCYVKPDLSLIPLCSFNYMLHLLRNPFLEPEKSFIYFLPSEVHDSPSEMDLKSQCVINHFKDVSIGTLTLSSVTFKTAASSTDTTSKPLYC